MSAVFQTLPGQEVPVGEIDTHLARLWADAADHGRPAPGRDEMKASQINLVLHFGFGTTPDDATIQFRHAASFASRYPSRVVVLCPHNPDTPAHEMRAKIYGECFLGRTPEDKRCCEFVLLSYPFAARQYLESQVSICLTPDLPVYYWAHRFVDCGHMADYQYLLTKARRFLLDGAAAPAGALDYPWPRPETVRDLAYARLLPVRQALGQFLARHTPAQLVAGLREVVVSHGAPLAAEGAALLRWVDERLRACGAPPGFSRTAVLSKDADALALQLHYDGPSDFIWSGHLAGGTACLAADFGDNSSRLTTPISLLPPEAALADAMFF